MLFNDFFNEYPYRDIESLNLDFIIKMMRKLENELINFVSLNTVTYADPIQWSITTQYKVNTVVVDPVTGTAYISKNPVPSGVQLSNTDYWLPIFDLNLFSVNQNLTTHDDGSNILATFDSTASDWLIWKGELYEVIRNIRTEEPYVPDYNIERYTVEMFMKRYFNTLKTQLDALSAIIGNVANLATSDKTSIVNAINELVHNIGSLGDLTTTDKTSIVNAINEILSTLSTEITNLNTLLSGQISALSSALSAETTARQNADSALSARIDNIKSSVFTTIFDFGATGTGGDETAAFQAAVNSGVKFVLVPEGDYVVNTLNLSGLASSGGTITFLVSPDSHVTGNGADQLGIWSNNEFVLGVASYNTQRHAPIKIEHVTSSANDSSVDAGVLIKDTILNNNDNLFHWGLLQISNDYSTNPANQNVGIYQQFNRYAVGESCWGIAIECRDRINGLTDETGGVRGMEISLSGVGAAPASGNRVGIHIICSDSDDSSQYQVNRGIYITAGGTRIGQSPDQNGFKAGIEMTSGYFEKGIYFHDMLLGYGIDFGNASFVQAAIIIPQNTSIDFSHGYHVQYNSGIDALRFIQNSNNAYVKSNGLIHCENLEVHGTNNITITGNHNTNSHTVCNHWIQVKIDGSNFYMPLYD